MHTIDLPQKIQIYLDNSLQELSIKRDDIGFWEVSDYGIFVLMTESFYKTLNYRKADPEDFYSRLQRGELPYTSSYPDSRQYMSVVIEHLRDCSLSPYIIDIGGYIGRFSLESALLVQKEGIIIPIQCLEPGLTGNIIKANLSINGVDKLVHLRAEAASDVDATTDYKYAPSALISGRICSSPSATFHRTVRTTRLETILHDIDCTKAVIIKIDTEGHEPNVMAGLGSLVNSIPIVCIVEFWPETLKSNVNGINYADFIEQNFIVLNIRSSLYPKFYTRISDIRKFARDFNYKEGNVDLLFVSKQTPNAAVLIDKLMALGV